MPSYGLQKLIIIYGPCHVLKVRMHIYGCAELEIEMYNCVDPGVFNY